MSHSGMFLGPASRLVFILLTIAVCAGNDADPFRGWKDLKATVALQDVKGSLDCMQDTLKENLRISSQTNGGIDRLAAKVDRVKQQVEQQKEQFVASFQDSMRDIVNDTVTQLKAVVGNISEVEEMTAKIKELETEKRNRDSLVATLQASLQHEMRKTREKVHEMQCPFMTTADKYELEQTILKKVQEYSAKKDWSKLKKALGDVLKPDTAAYKQLQRIDDGASNPLFVVGSQGRTELAELLVTYGRAVNVTDKHGTTLLYGAAYSGDVKASGWLLEHGADIEVGSTAGRTPLMNAAERGHLGLVKYLVNSGASTTATNEDGDTALQCAKDSGKEDVVKYLTLLPH